MDPAGIYRAAVRVVMRLVVLLFAESRELLPRDNALYHDAYGLSGLLEELEKTAARGGRRLARSWGAWPRVMALFRLDKQVWSVSLQYLLPAFEDRKFMTLNINLYESYRRKVEVIKTLPRNDDLACLKTLKLIGGSNCGQ